MKQGIALRRTRSVRSLGPSWIAIGLSAIIGLLDLFAGLAAPSLAVQLGWQPVAIGLGAAALALALLWPIHDRWLGAGGAVALALAGVLGFLGAVPLSLQVAGGAAFIAAIMGARLRKLSAPNLSAKDEVKVERAGRTKSVPVAEIITGDRVIVTDGEVIPVDGTVERGHGFVDEAVVTGSGLPAPKREGDKVYAGTISATPELVIRAERPEVESLRSLKERAGQHLFESTLEARAAGRGLAGLLLIVSGIAGGLAAWKTGDLASALSAVTVVLLLVPAALPSLTLLLAQKRAQSLAYERGMVISRAKDLFDLTKVRRWQVEPGLLSAPGTVEVVVFADTPAETLIVVAEALLDDSDGPERIAMSTSREKLRLERVQGAAFKASGGVRHGTVNGRRWFLGSPASVKEVEKQEIAKGLEGTAQFLDDRSSMVLFVGRPDEGILGAIGVQLQVVPEMKNAAVGLQATLLGGLPDQVRQSLALLAGIACDGPPATAKDAALLSPTGIPPSRGQRIRVVPLSAEALLKEDAAPRIFSPAVANLPGIVEGLKSTRRSAQVGVAIMIGTALVGVALTVGLAGLFPPGVAALIGAGGVLFHTR